VLWTLMGVTAVVGYLFRYGTGNKLLEQPLPHKIVIVICMLIFLYNIGMTIWKSKRFTTTEGVLVLGLGLAPCCTCQRCSSTRTTRCPSSTAGGRSTSGWKACG
jgi:hypothetical protein